MKTRQRRSVSAEMKARIALEAIKGQRTIQEIASHYGVHPNQVTTWRRQAVTIGNIQRRLPLPTRTASAAAFPAADRPRPEDDQREHEDHQQLGHTDGRQHYALLGRLTGVASPPARRAGSRIQLPVPIVNQLIRG